MSLFDVRADTPRRGDEPLLVLDGRTLTRADVARCARSLATLVREAPLVSFVARPSEPALVLALAAISFGVPILPLHPRFTAVEVAAIRARFGDTKHVDEPEIAAALASGSAAGAFAPADDERLLAILLSSGTSGEPKGARLSRRAFAASARASEANLGWEPRDRWLLSMPFSHAGGLSILTRCLAAHRPIVVHAGFDPDRIVDSVAREGVSLLSVVPTMLASLLERPGADRLSALRAILVGGAACPPDLVSASRARGIRVLTTYGLTEACSQVTTQPFDRPELWTSLDSGVALPGVTLRVVDAAGNAVVGQEGRIHVGGPTLMSGYVGDDGEVAPLFETGDLGVVDERGRLFVSGRADDVIVTGGENVSPLEVERALRGIAGVVDVCVVGLDEPRWGSVVGALFALEPGRDLALVLEAARERLAPHKRPRKALAVASLPRGATGKPDRRAARAQLLAG